MDSLMELIEKRKSGRVRICFASYWGEGLPDVLARFGLSCTASPDAGLREVQRVEARTIVASLLHRDMAYKAEIMSTEEAESLADRFLEQFPSDKTRFLTNLGRSKDQGLDFDTSWNPLTSATFDAGVICISERIAGCFWAEDED
jgi:hypothetical protein